MAIFIRFGEARRYKKKLIGGRKEKMGNGVFFGKKSFRLNPLRGQVTMIWVLPGAGAPNVEGRGKGNHRRHS